MNQEEDSEVKQDEGSQPQSSDSSAEEQTQEDESQQEGDEEGKLEKKKKGLESTVQNLKSEVEELREERRTLRQEDSSTEDSEGDDDSPDPDQVRQVVEEEVEPLKQDREQRQQELLQLALADMNEESEFHKIHTDKDSENKNFDKVKEQYNRIFDSPHTTPQGMKEGLKRAYAAAFPDEFAQARADKAKKEGQVEGANAMRADAGGTSSDVKGPEAGVELSPEEKRMLDRFNQGRAEEDQMTPKEYKKLQEGEMPEVDWR